jgi:bile acid-coenzyme A ligase
MTQSGQVPPIGTQISALAALAPDEPAVTCDGRTITRGELDSSTNRLARAYAERGVGVGGYVTIALPNSIEWMQAAVACWKLGAVPQPLSAGLPKAEFEGLLELRPRALLVGRTSGEIPSVPAGFIPDPALSDGPLPEAVSPCWKSMASGGSTGRPKLIEVGGDSRVPPTLGYAMGAQEGDTALVPVPLTHNTGFTAAAIALLLSNHLVLMSRFEPHEFLRLITDHPRRSSPRCRRSCSACCRSTAPTQGPTTCRRSGGSGTWARPARLPSSRPGSTSLARKRSGSSTAAPNYRR